MEREAGHLWIGEQLNAEGDRAGEAVHLDSSDLTTHGVIVGMTGSGKTGMGVVLLEEALLAGIPVLAIDPKGDLGNLCLTFPSLAGPEFEPWVDEGAARVQETTVPELAAKVATTWRDGLASWGLDGTDVGALGEAARPVIYTPGSDAGVGLDVLGRLSAPSGTDPGARQDEIDSTVSGLLGLIGVESDPLSGREHILLANLIARAWDAGKDLDLATLLGQLLDPPIRKLGVLDLDAFFPPKDRQALAMKLNGLLASPSFAAWSQGAPLDIQRMLWDADGKARAAVLSLGHLEETERQFAVTLVLSKLISWMRTQPGTGELRVLVYLDEVMGLAPPNGNPPPKKPILTLLKQARAFGVGLVLSTQNPVDLDYKAISNAGTWLIGRLQTEQDKNRLVDGLKAADGSVDMSKLNATISGLGKRQFLLRTTRNSEMPLLTSRWALSYLAGPLTRKQIGRLMAEESAAQAAKSPAAASAAAGAQAAPEAAAAASSAPSAPAAAPASTLADDESTVAPSTPDSLSTRFVVPSAPWLAELDTGAGGSRLRPALATRVALLFDERKADLRHEQEWEAIISLDGDRIDVDNAIQVDFDDRDFTSDAPDDAVYILPSFDLSASAIRSAQSDLKNMLTSQLTLTLFNNPELKLWSRPGESREDFSVRCEAAADDGADEEGAKLRAKLEAKRDRVEAAIAKSEDRVSVLEAEAEGRKHQQVIDIGTSILGGLLGGRSRTRGMASAARRMSSSSRQKNTSETRVDAARNRVAEHFDDLEELEGQLHDAVFEIDAEWSEKADAIEEEEIPMEKTDIRVNDFMLVWIPTER